MLLNITAIVIKCKKKTYMWYSSALKGTFLCKDAHKNLQLRFIFKNKKE